MALTTFTSGQILTAAQMNAVQANDYNQTVSTKTASYTLVAADKGTRVVMNSASATTITVNTSLFSAGDTLVLQNIGAGVCTVTAGTATVATAGSLAIPQNGSGLLYFTSAGVSIYYPSAVTATPSALVRVGGGALSGATTAFTNVFSATYNNYLISISNVTNAGNAWITMILGATTTGYYSSSDFNAYANNSSFTQVCYMNASGGAGMINLGNPFLSKFTVMSSLTPPLVTGGASSLFSGFLNNSTSYTGFTLGGGTFTGGTCDIYGYTLS